MTLASKLRTFTRQYACVVLRASDRVMVGYAGSAGEGDVALTWRAARKFRTYPDAIVWALAHGRSYGPERALDVVGLTDLESPESAP